MQVSNSLFSPQLKRKSATKHHFAFSSDGKLRCQKWYPASESLTILRVCTSDRTTEHFYLTCRGWLWSLYSGSKGEAKQCYRQKDNHWLHVVRLVGHFQVPRLLPAHPNTPSTFSVLRQTAKKKKTVERRFFLFLMYTVHKPLTRFEDFQRKLSYLNVLLALAVLAMVCEIGRAEFHHWWPFGCLASHEG